MSWRTFKKSPNLVTLAGKREIGNRLQPQKTFVSTSTGGLSTSVSFFLFFSLSLFRGPFYIMLICLYHFFLYHSIYLSIYLPISYISLYQSNYLPITYLPIFLSTYICQSIYLPITYLSMLIALWNIYLSFSPLSFSSLPIQPSRSYFA